MKFSKLRFTSTACYQLIYEKTKKQTKIEVVDVRQGLVRTEVWPTFDEASRAVDSFIIFRTLSNPLERFGDSPLFVAYEREENKWSILYGNNLGKFEDTGLRYDSEKIAREFVANHAKKQERAKAS